ncbi:ATP-binding protein [Thermogutta sp.]|uniref:two-component system sensor histidine kinase NtrB n=1 Tax=Thermogutta sp. TaxID=1962930 RepID=UPI00321FBCB6
MKLPPSGAIWLIRIRWLAASTVFVATTLGYFVLGVLQTPYPLYAVGLGMLLYNAVLAFIVREESPIRGFRPEDSFFLQIVLDLVALTLVLYFSDFCHNPFVIYYIFHMIIAGMYLRGARPYIVAGATALVIGAIIFLESLNLIPRCPLRFGGQELPPLHNLEALALFCAVATSLGMATYFTTSIRRYVDRAHAELRQKEKMLGIGQLVAGIAHQIANPLDGVQNCLRRISEAVKNDPRLTEYVNMMAEALERIERTAKRVQAFAQPRGLVLEKTDVNAAVEGTLAMLGTRIGQNIRVEKDLRPVPPVLGDKYTIQEVVFNLCTNALAAMPNGGTLTLRTRTLGTQDDDQMNSVAIEVIDTGVGIPRANLERIFEPFFTTRADSGGTGLGLGLCRMLISEMGGRIEVRSTLGQGTTFTVILNAYRDKDNKPA